MDLFNFKLGKELISQYLGQRQCKAFDYGMHQLIPITIAADNILKYFFIIFHREISIDISCELSAKQTIHMKCQDLFSMNLKKINK